MSLFVVVVLEDREESGERRTECSNSSPESMPKIA